jgi:hypothetical protein
MAAKCKDIMNIKRLTGADLSATRRFLLEKCFVPGQGFLSQYVGQSTLSCATTAICIYALCEMGQLTQQQKVEFRDVLLRFRKVGGAGAFPRTTGAAPSVWTTGQAVLALLSLETRWDLVKPSVEWLLRAQSPDGGWIYAGTHEGRERLIYAFYPTLVFMRCRRRMSTSVAHALSRVHAFLRSCEELQDPFWVPLRRHLLHLVDGKNRRKDAHNISLDAYGQLFEENWPVAHVDEDWLSTRFSMALMCGPNYLHLRPQIEADHPLALLHIRYLADERIETGWNDRREHHVRGPVGSEFSAS